MATKFKVEYGVEGRFPDCRYFGSLEKARGFADGIDLASMWETEYNCSGHTSVAREKVFYKEIIEYGWSDLSDCAFELVNDSLQYERYGYTDYERSIIGEYLD